VQQLQANQHMSPCSPNVLHGTYDLGSQPSVTLFTVQDVRLGAANTDTQLHSSFVPLHHSYPSGGGLVCRSSEWRRFTSAHHLSRLRVGVLVACRCHTSTN